MTLVVQRLDTTELVGWQKVTFGPINAYCTRDSRSGVRVVAGQHGRLDAQRMKLGNGLPAAFLDGIGHCKQCQGA